MAYPDRAEVIALLDQLGADDDAAVLAAARALHRRVDEAGLSWDELMAGLARPVPTDDETGLEAAPAGPAGDGGDTARLIERLLRKGVSDELRQDLAEMKRALAEGTLDPEDARYVQALARRLGV